MTETPRGLRPHIVMVGKCNAGKSSFINAITETEVSIVSEVRGTTTDPVYKNMELLPFGPVTFVDTPGIDDQEGLGKLRVDRSKKELSKADLVVFVTRPSEYEPELLKEIKALARAEVPAITVFTHLDVESESQSLASIVQNIPKTEIFIATSNIDALMAKAAREKLSQILTEKTQKQLPLLAGLVKPGDLVVLVVPIDLEAPKGRLILPQVQTIRETLDGDSILLIVKERELDQGLGMLTRDPDLVICDSQVVLKVASSVKPSIKLTTFSILLSRQKGELDDLIKNARLLRELKDGDKILIAEACTHHTMCDDIGRVKIPRFLRQYSGKNLDISFASGNFPDNLKHYDLIIHCGACMITRNAMLERMNRAQISGASMTNYGMAISETQGLLERVLEPFN